MLAFPALKSRLVPISLLLLLRLSCPALVLPDDPRAVINVVKENGAKGDGVADDTAAIQKAIENTRAATGARVVFLPAGTYHITKKLVFQPAGGGTEGYANGPWLIGEGKDKVTIKLHDMTAGFTDPADPQEVLRGLSRPDGAKMNADFFSRVIQNLTLDCGDNPGAIGIKFYSNNKGIMENVIIKGNGVIGLDLGFNDQNGPLLVKDVEIDGFATGISTKRAINSQAISNVTIRNASKVGLSHESQVFSVEGLKVINSPIAVESAKGFLTLADCTFEAGSKSLQPAIKIPASGRLYVRNLKTTGYTQAIEAPALKDGGVKAAEVTEYASHDFEKVASSGSKGLMLPAAPVPHIEAPAGPDDWVCANDFGSEPGDKVCDADGIQKAIDKAASEGKSSVYILGGQLKDPNWYSTTKDVRIHGSVRRLTGIGFCRLLGGSKEDPEYPDNLSKFVIDDDPGGAKAVLIENIAVFSPKNSFGIEVKSANRALVFRHGTATIQVRRNASAFLVSVPGHLFMEPGSKVWARQYNPEGGMEDRSIACDNDGGQLWVLGLKTERGFTKVSTRNGGKTEILGTLNYNYSGYQGDDPYLLVESGGQVFSGPHLEVNFSGKWYPITVGVRSSPGSIMTTKPAEKWHAWAAMRAGD